MKVWRQLISLILAITWMPMMHSCEIAQALGIELPTQDAHQDSPVPADDGCDHCNFCETLESGGVAPCLAKVKIPDFVALFVVWQPQWVALEDDALPPEAAILRSDHDRPPQRWQFVERTALPPRAPSFRA